MIALARADRSAVALLKALRGEETRIVIPAPVLAEVLRGGSKDAAVHRILAAYANEVVPTSAHAARLAGELLGAAQAGAEMTVGALIGATAATYGATDLLTADARDYGRLMQGRLDVIPLA